MRYCSKKENIFLATILLVFFLTAFFSANRKAPVFDEGIHITAGYNAWTNRDFRVNPENGLFPGMLGAFPLLFDSGLKFPSNSKWWQICDHWKITKEFLFQTGNDFQQIFFQGRIMIMIFALSGGIAVFLASRRLWGRTGAFISLILFVLSPTILAHSRFVTSDMVAAILFFIATMLFWNLLNRFTPLRLLWLVIALAFLALSKMSAILILPVLIIISIIRILIRKKWAIKYFSKSLIIKKKLPQAGLVLVTLIFSGLCALFIIWGAYNFRYSMLVDNQGNHNIQERVWPYLLKEGNFTAKTIGFVRDHHLIPEAYLLGFAYVIHNADFRYAFLNGNYSPTGWRSFFPLTFAYKTPIPIMILFLFGLGGIILQAVNSKSKPQKMLLLWYASAPIALIVVYLGVAIFSKLNIGHRHILPIYLPLFVLAGGTSIWIKKYHKPAFIGVLVLLTALLIENLLIFPNYLAYFNLIAGGPANGYKHLVDSSLDWGQDLQGLKEWIQSKGLDDDKVYISYFGSVDLDAYGMQQKRLFCFFEQNRPKIFRLRGGTYCISATMLQMVYYPSHVQWNRKSEKELKHYQKLFFQLENAKTDPRRMQKLLESKGTEYWLQVCRKYEKLRFAKLVAVLRGQPPHEMVNNTYLIYQLKDDDIDYILNNKAK